MAKQMELELGDTPLQGWDRREEGGLDVGTAYDLEPLCH